MSRCCPELYKMSGSLAQANSSFRKTNSCWNEISHKWSLASPLQIDYNRGVVFPTSALISTARTPLVLFLERVVPVWQLGVSEEAWCVVSLLDVTHFRACYSFLICCVKVVLPICFCLFSLFGLSRSSLTLLFPCFLFSFFSLSTCDNVAEVSLLWQPPRKWKDPVLMQAGQTLAYHRQTFSTSD